MTPNRGSVPYWLCPCLTVSAKIRVMMWGSCPPSVMLNFSSCIVSQFRPVQKLQTREQWQKDKSLVNPILPSNWGITYYTMIYYVLYGYMDIYLFIYFIIAVWRPSLSFSNYVILGTWILLVGMLWSQVWLFLCVIQCCSVWSITQKDLSLGYSHLWL